MRVQKCWSCKGNGCFIQPPGVGPHLKNRAAHCVLPLYCKTVQMITQKAVETRVSDVMMSLLQNGGFTDTHCRSGAFCLFFQIFTNQRISLPAKGKRDLIKWCRKNQNILWVSRKQEMDDLNAFLNEACFEKAYSFTKRSIKNKPAKPYHISLIHAFVSLDSLHSGRSPYLLYSTFKRKGRVLFT